MSYEDTISELSALSGNGNTPYSAAEQQRIAALYYEIFHRRIRDCKCPDKWRDAVVEMLINLKKQSKMKKMCKYKLRPGEVIHTSDGRVYTNDNLTDKVAKEFLKKRPGATAKFEYTPDTAGDPVGADGEDGAPGALDRVAELEERIAELEGAIAQYDTVVAEYKEKIAELEGADDDEDDEIPSELNEKIKALVREGLSAGKTKQDLKKELAGGDVDGVKLTQTLVGMYIKAVESEK